MRTLLPQHAEVKVPRRHRGAWSADPGVANGRGFIEFAVANMQIGMTPSSEPSCSKSVAKPRQLPLRFGGAGLVLAITRKLAHMMGGDATVTSEPGKRSVFTVRLPGGS